MYNVPYSTLTALLVGQGKRDDRNGNIKVRSLTEEIWTQKRDTRWVGKREGQKDRRGREERE